MSLSLNVNYYWRILNVDTGYIGCMFVMNIRSYVSVLIPYLYIPKVYVNIVYTKKNQHCDDLGFYDNQKNLTLN